MSNNAVLVIGSGGREHALATVLARSAQVTRVYCAPGNGGTDRVASNIALNVADHESVVRFVSDNGVGLTVIGPEAPLVAGLSDALRARGHRVVGASRRAAQLEGSKVFAKNFMVKYDIPTADFRVFSSAADALQFAESPEGRPFRVLKADGLAAGKGVFVTQSAEEMRAAITSVMVDRVLGSAGEKVIMEEGLQGPEVSLMALTDGNTLLPFPASQDHKRAFDRDEGPNTGGMGAYAPTPFYDDLTRLKISKNIIDNFLRGVVAEKLEYRGVIYFGLMLTEEGPKVLEFNARLGDPEAQTVLPLIQSDLYEAFSAVADGKLAEIRFQLRPEAACTVVLASGGYPGSFETGMEIDGLDAVEASGQVFVFHAGTQKVGGRVVTNGGRVLNVVGLGKDLDSAVVRAYQSIKKISFKNMHFRHDIAAKALKNSPLSAKIRRMKSRHMQSSTEWSP